MPILPGLPPIDVLLRRSARSKRFSLRIRSTDGRVTLSMPLRARESDAMAFVFAQEGWIRNALANQPVSSELGFGMTIPYQGQLLTLTQGPGRTVQIIGDSLLVPGDPSQMLPRLKAWLKLRARDRLVAATDHYATKLGRRVSRITLRDTRSRWGSCTADGALMYSWRLIMAPPAVLDYVAAHEVAHLIEMNHSERFWGVVDQLYPKWQSERAWLRVHGGALQRFRFEQS